MTSCELRMPSAARSSPNATGATGATSDSAKSAKGAMHAASAKEATRRGAIMCGCIAGLLLGLQHRRQNAIGRPIAVEERLDIDDHLLAHVDAPFERVPC